LRSAELKVFNALRNLPDKYRVFYGLHWQDRREDYGVREGEADFIIAHPDQGVIVLEVKGGGIRFDAESGKWHSQSRDGTVYEITDPVDQGRRNHYEILKKLENLPAWKLTPLNIWHAVCFPDVRLKPGQFLKPDLPREFIIDSEDLQDALTSITTVLEITFGQVHQVRNECS
jgi:hypothetical protein